jgi:hypothetical protein
MRSVHFPHILVICEVHILVICELHILAFCEQLIRPAFFKIWTEFKDKIEKSKTVTP